MVGFSEADAIAALTRPGSVFETTTEQIDGVPLRVFQHLPRNLAALYALAGHFDSRTFVVHEDERFSLGQVRQAAHNLAHALRHRYGVSKGDRVALAMRNYPEWCFAYMAITSIGAIVVPLNAWWEGAELEFGMRDSGASVLIADRERFDRVRGRLDVRSLSVLVARPDGPLPEGVDDLAASLRGSASASEVDVGPDDAASLLYTSGSTGDPKGVVSTHRAVLSSIMTWEFQAYARMLVGLSPELRACILDWSMRGASALAAPPLPWPPSSILVNVPLFHVTGCNVQFLPSFRNGRKLVMMRRWNPERALELIERERITDFTGVPTMSWELVNSPDFHKRDTSSLRSLGAGGAARPPEQVRELRDKARGVLPGAGYGMTETNAVATSIAGPEYERRPGSVGRALAPLVEIQVTDAQGRPLAAGEEGQIRIKSATNMRGYWNRPEDTAQTLRDGWLCTGDLGHLDADCYLYITGRAKDIVIRGGENISCAEVERAVYEHPSVGEVAAFGVPDERLGEALAISVMLRSGCDATPEELIAHVAARLAKFKVPSYVLLQREPLPRVASGKVDKRALAARFKSG